MYPLKDDPFIIKYQRIMDILTSYRLETTEVNNPDYYSPFDKPKKNTISLNAGIYLSYDKSYTTLVGLEFDIKIVYPYQYIGEDRDSYDSNKAVYYYIKESINNKFGEGLSFDNREINDNDIQVFHKFLSQDTLKTIKEISVSYWVIEDDKLLLYLYLEKNGNIQIFIDYGNDYYWNKYK
jgi:hypothetical protein